MRPTETLMHEHEIIMLVLNSAEAIIQSDEFPFDDVEKIANFLKYFADGCHHKKEEKYFFVRLGERGFSVDQGPVAVMLHEHEIGRKFIRAIFGALPLAQTGDKNAIGIVKDNLDGYIQLLRGHIYKENNILFPMSNQVLIPHDQLELEKDFEKVEREEMGRGTHEKYHQLAYELQKKYLSVLPA